MERNTIFVLRKSGSKKRIDDGERKAIFETMKRLKGIAIEGTVIEEVGLPDPKSLEIALCIKLWFDPQVDKELPILQTFQEKALMIVITPEIPVEYAVLVARRYKKVPLFPFNVKTHNGIFPLHLLLTRDKDNQPILV